MAKFQIRIDVSKIDKESLYKGEKGTYLTLECVELKQASQYGDTHLVKQQLSKEVYQKMTEEQKKNIPILGNMKPSKFQPVQTVEAEEVNPQRQQQEAAPATDDSGLPF